jgi:hypothetical protein
VLKEKIEEMKADQGDMAQLLKPSYLRMKNTRRSNPFFGSADPSGGNLGWPPDSQKTA